MHQRRRGRCRQWQRADPCDAPFDGPLRQRIDSNADGIASSHAIDLPLLHRKLELQGVRATQQHECVAGTQFGIDEQLGACREHGARHRRAQRQRLECFVADRQRGPCRRGTNILKTLPGSVTAAGRDDRFAFGGPNGGLGAEARGPCLDVAQLREWRAGGDLAALAHQHTVDGAAHQRANRGKRRRSEDRRVCHHA